MCEIDLLWLICCKKINFKDTKIYYYTLRKDLPEEDERKILMETYGAEICYLDSESYDDLYEYAFEIMKNQSNAYDFE